MPSRKMKVEVVNYPHNWTFWNQIVWTNTQKASTSSYDGRDNVVHCNAIQVLRPVRKYHFDDVCVCFTKDADNYSFIQHLLQLSTIQYEGNYNLKKMSKEKMIAHVTQLHDAQKRSRRSLLLLCKKKLSLSKLKYLLKYGWHHCMWIIINLTNTDVMVETPEVQCNHSWWSWT